MSNLRELSWAERFAIIDAQNPTDEQILAALDIDADELATARELREAGQFADAGDLNLADYEGAFEGLATADVEDISVTETDDSSTEDTSTATTTPVTATKPVKQPKKRGRKGTKIAQAFAAIPSTPTDAAAFAAQHNISLNVLRQAKRFDSEDAVGRVRHRTIDGVVCVYRELPEDSE
jgi:hypothetical protein